MHIWSKTKLHIYGKGVGMISSKTVGTEERFGSTFANCDPHIFLRQV